MEDLFICFGVLAGLCLLAALPLSVVALILAVRAARRAENLCRRLEAGERPAAPSARPSPPPVPAPPPRKPAAPGAKPASVASHAPPPQPPVPVPDGARPTRPRHPIRWEEWIGLKGLAWVGMIVLLIGAALLAKYLHLGPWGRIVAEIVAGLVALALGEVFARKAYRVLARVCTGGGLALEYFAVFSARVLEGVIPEPPAWILMAVITGVAIVFAVRYASLAIAVLSLVGGLAAPLLMHPARDPGHALFLYLIAVNAGVLVLAYFKKWRVLNLLALLGTVVNVTVWLFSHYWHGETATEKLPFILAYMTALWGMYFVLSIVYHLLGEREPSRLDLPVTLVNVMAYFGGLYALLQADHHWVLGPAAAGLGAIYLAEGLTVRWLAARHMPFVLLQLAQAIGLATLAIPIQLEGIFIPMAWAVEAAVLFYLGVRLAAWRLRAVGLLVHLASLVGLAYFAEEAWETAGPVLANARTATFAVVALAMAVSAYLSRRVERRSQAETVGVTIASGVAHAVLMVLIALEIFWWADQVRTALAQQHLHPVQIHEGMQRFLWLRDAFTAIGLAVYALAAVGAAAILRRTVHQVMALVGFAAGLVFVALSLPNAPAPEWLVALDGVGATFAAVTACLGVAAVVSRYATPAPLPRRRLAITYELLAIGVVAGLYVASVFRAESYAMTHRGVHLPQATVHSLLAAGAAAFAAGLMLRGFWLRSAAHRAFGLLALVAGLVLLMEVSLWDRHPYGTLFWNPRGAAFLLAVAATALAAVGYLRTMPRDSGERRVFGPVLAVLVHPVALACFTLEAMDFWDAHADAWFAGRVLDAWYARHATLSVGYALYALVLLAAGMARRSVLARMSALVILGVTLAKVLLLDLSRLEAIWRILSFIGLGLLLLAASWLYYRYRHLLFTQEPPAAEKEEKETRDASP